MPKAGGSPRIRRKPAAQEVPGPWVPESGGRRNKTKRGTPAPAYLAGWRVCAGSRRPIGSAGDTPSAFGIRRSGPGAVLSRAPGAAAASNIPAGDPRVLDAQEFFLLKRDQADKEEENLVCGRLDGQSSFGSGTTFLLGAGFPRLPTRRCINLQLLFLAAPPAHPTEAAFSPAAPKYRRSHPRAPRLEHHHFSSLPSSFLFLNSHPRVTSLAIAPGNLLLAQSPSSVPPSRVSRTPRVTRAAPPCAHLPSPPASHRTPGPNCPRKRHRQSRSTPPLPVSALKLSPLPPAHRLTYTIADAANAITPSSPEQSDLRPSTQHSGPATVTSNSRTTQTATRRRT